MGTRLHPTPPRAAAAKRPRRPPRAPSKGFQMVMLGLSGAFVVSLVGLTILQPRAAVTAAPRAVLALPATIEIETAARHDAPAPAAAGGLAAGDRLSATTADALWDTFVELGYQLDAVQRNGELVPRLRMVSLPGDLADVSEISRRKALFFKSILPLVLQANEQILADRERLWTIRHRARMGLRLAAADRLWLNALAERYGTQPDSFDQLLTMLDIVPPSLALAQSAEESGWGTSRFVREGNALFGQYTTAEDGHLVPLARDDDADFRVRAFPNLIDSVRAYMHNLNTHAAYGRFRAVRAALRRSGDVVDGARLARELARYSARGEGYVRSLLTIMDVNGLAALDSARLVGGRRDGSPQT